MNSNYNIQLSDSAIKATETYNTDGSIVLEGRKAKRVQVLPDDARFNFVYKNFSTLGLGNIILGLQILTGHYVPLQVGNQKIYVNVMSFHKRFHQDISTVKEAGSDKLKFEALQALATKMHIVINKYDSAIKQISQKSNVKDTVEKGMGKTGALSQQFLMKVVKTAVEQLKKGSQPHAVEFKEGEHHVIAHTDKKADVHIYVVIGKIQAGGCGTVDRVWRVGEDLFAMKRAFKGFEANLRNEQTIRKEIHSAGPLEAVQKPALHVGKLSNGEVFSVEELYEGNYSKKPIPTTLKNLMKEFTDICKGIAIMHSKGIVHGDLKAANCLYKNGQVVIADVGGARNTNQEDWITRAKIFTHKSQEDAIKESILDAKITLLQGLQDPQKDQQAVISKYKDTIIQLPDKKDRTECEKFLESSKSLSNEEIRKQLNIDLKAAKKHAKSIDIDQAGGILGLRLQDCQALFKDIKGIQIQEEFLSLILQMTDEDSDNRPTIKKVLTALANIEKTIPTQIGQPRRGQKK